MKKTFALVALATIAVASCTKSEYLGQNAQAPGTSSPIQIGTSVGVPTKASGADAATLLGNKFIVWGQKTVSSATSDVFDKVPVHYTNGEWSYVATGQALRYWDTNASGYDFIAISDANDITSMGKDMEYVTPKSDVYTDGFSIASVTADELAKIHVTNVHNVNSASFSSPVTFNFSNAAAKVRVAFYNAIPGYEVNVDKFYVYAGTETENTVLKGNFYNKAAYNVSNTGALTVGASTPATDIELGNKIVQCPNANQYIGKTITSASFDKADNAYTNVLPVMDAGADINMKVTYRMISGHDIISRTCNVTIPAEYAKWQSNYAYTYAFKITDNDLHPITFSATVVDPEKQETTTTIDGDNPVNITLYSAGSDLMANGGVKVGNDVFVSVKNVPGGVFDVHTGFTTEDDVNGSNAASFITDWTERTETTGGRYQILADTAGYYVVRVSWVVAGVTKHAYMVFKCVA